MTSSASRRRIDDLGMSGLVFDASSFVEAAEAGAAGVDDVFFGSDADIVGADELPASVVAAADSDD